jgi:type I restriction enzyme M protein
MLDNETKRRIDTARDILVGKLPDPKSQVEQITIALIYKFMDDMDVQAVEYGGEPSFFVGDYERFGWRKIFSPSIGGFEMLNLYGEAITSLNQNPNLPQLFRDVFKNAFLPYRDPETLKLFLKTINEFKYDHSERLGDAFEYLLSVLGSQGDAGQFRTPRHIIDFIVEVVQPKKSESVCDPACGTAGFLISAYKHILKANTRRTPGDLLTPDELKRLMTNFVGYDISPDMVRLSLVNLYLHGFPDPHIYEYDTLTSEERWNESFDVVMANPPFMSPKGGIKPHKRFSLQANRSEVLFIDYIAEHINPVLGRASVIVPEGIIFQSANAYRDLRKMLVEKAFLYAVVSLPAGVFQPYSGVKTSILFFDKTLALKSAEILFVKISNDGFGLGAQRKELKTSELPDALNIILDFQKAILSGDTSRFLETELPLQAFAVEKSRIAENADFNLSGDRYRASQIRPHKFDSAKLGDIAEYINGYPFKPEDWTTEGKKIIRIQNLTGSSKTFNHTAREDIPEKYIVKKGDLLISWSATIGFYIWNDEVAYLNQHIFRAVPNEKVLKSYLYILGDFVKGKILDDVHGNTMQHITKGRFDNIEIPLPPVSVQKEIVEHVEGYQRLINGANQVVQSFNPNIQINPNWQIVELGEICEWITKGTTPTSLGFKYEDEGVKFIRIENINDDGNIDRRGMKYISEECNNKMERSKLKKNDILFSIAGTKMGITGRVTEELLPANTNQALAIIRPKEEVDSDFLFHYLKSKNIQNEIERIKVGVAQFNLSLKQVSELKIALPSIEEQKRIVAQIEREQYLVNANHELIEIYEQKIKDEINQLWES